MSYITPAVEVHLQRPDLSVRLCTCKDVPEKFGVRIAPDKQGIRKSCTFQVGDENLQAASVHLLLSTWSCNHAHEIAFNGTRLVERIGPVHNYSYDIVPLPVSLLKRGTNEFSIYSATPDHAAEVNWPGPGLLVEYQGTRKE